jgi:Tfp pilus assembly protein PilO
VGRFSRIINIEGLKIQNIRVQDSGADTIDASFTAKTFIYKEPVPVVEEGAEQDQ